MNDEGIKVTVCRYPDRCNLVLRFVDPVTGQQKTKSAGTADEATAIGKAAVWQDELTTGRYQSASRLTWKAFRARYEAEKLSSLAPGTRATARDCLNYLERIGSPDRLCKVTATVMSQFQAALRKRGLADATIARHLRHIKAALRWGERQGLIAKAPAIEMPQRVKGQTMMRGRPIAGEEFDRMIAAVPKVRKHDAAVWVRYLTGLWLSGLRREESLVLSWEQDAPFYADLTGRRPAFRIYAEAQKARRDAILPMTPDFAQFLAETPAAERVGPVFKLPTLTTGKPMVAQEVGRMVSLIGKTAGVVVNKAAGKFASCHDLRRSFATRWAPRVKPATLQLLMRHADISTTLKYYVAQDAADVADELWAGWGKTTAEGNILGNIAPKEAKVGHA